MPNIRLCSKSFPAETFSWTQGDQLMEYEKQDPIFNLKGRKRRKLFTTKAYYTSHTCVKDYSFFVQREDTGKKN